LEFNAGTIGVVDLHQMLPVWSLPGRRADPSISDDLVESPTAFPINYAVGRISAPDWSNPSDADFLGYLEKFEGIDECSFGGRGLASSTLKMNLHRDFDPDSPTLMEVLWHQVSLPTLPGAYVTVKDIFVERLPQYVDHHRANITFREHVHLYDRSLVDTPWRDHVLSHVTEVQSPLWVPEGSGIDPATVFTFAVGDSVVPSDIELYVVPWMPAFLLDYTLEVPSDFGVGYGNEHFAVDDPIGPERGGFSGNLLVDLLAGRYSPDGVRNLTVQPRYPQNFLIQASCGPGGGPSIR
jgi:hypothetical protein